MECTSRTERRKLYLERAKKTAREHAEHTEQVAIRERKAERAEARKVYASSVSELTRGANKIGVIHNTKVKVTVGSFAHGSAPQTMVFHGRHTSYLD